MTHIKVTINGDVKMDGDLGQWSSEPPFISDERKAIAAKQDDPWSLTILALIAQAGAAMTTNHTTLDITTHPGGWTLTVTTTP